MYRLPSQASTTIPKSEKSLDAVAEIIRQEYISPPSIDQLADQVNMSRSHLTHSFRQHFGTSIMEFALQLRMIKARELLHSGQHSVLTVALMLGYQNHANFTRAYRKHFGHPPSEDVAR
nr:helix-turn-helix transcriptional regulator [Pseudomaricurvus alkylphenolicus]